jgi:thymidylate kinase
MADRAVSELIAFEGPSKSGKTTLAKALSLALRIPKWEPVRVSKHTPTEEEVERFKYRTKAFPYFVLDELSLLRHIPLIIVDRHPGQRNRLLEI